MQFLIEEELKILAKVMKFTESQHSNATDWFCPVEHMQFDLAVMKTLVQTTGMFDQVLPPAVKQKMAIEA